MMQDTPTPLFRDYDGKDLLRLLRFYLACVDEEDRKSLTLPLGGNGRSFISPWDECEELFHPDASEIRFTIQGDSEKNFLTKRQLEAGEPDRFFYGYPFFLNLKAELSPLFYCEVTVEDAKEGSFLLRPNQNSIQLNHHAFYEIQAEELLTLQEELEDPSTFGTFSMRLSAALQHFQLPPTKTFNPDGLDPFPSAGGAGWYNRPILFQSARNNYTAHLRTELLSFLKEPSLATKTAGTALGALLKSSSVHEILVDEELPLEVLPLNDQQRSAVREAMTHPLTVITGPPGTGKSQVVVNLLAIAVHAGQTVLFASKNNKAVDVVRERLHMILGESEDWTLRLGSGHHMSQSREEMNQRLTADLAKLPPTWRRSRTLQTEIQDANRSLHIATGLLARIRGCHQEIVEGEEKRRLIEVKLPEEWRDIPPPSFESLAVSWDVLTRSRDDAYALAGHAQLGWLLWFLRLVLGPGLRRRILERFAKVVSSFPPTIAEQAISDVEAQPEWETLFLTSQNLLYYVQWAQIDAIIHQKYESITTKPTAEALARDIMKRRGEKAALSRELFRITWTSKITKSKGLVRSLMDKYFDCAGWSANRTDMSEAFTSSVRSLCHHLPLWIVTSLSARRSLPLEPALFDLVVIDEASQSDIASALPLLFRAKRAVIIGDPHQLRHISSITPKREAEVAKESDVLDLLPDWPYISRSLFDVAEAAVAREGREPVFLNEHYRSHPSIIEFSNREFYGGRLILRTSVPDLQKRLSNHSLGVFWHDVKGSASFSSSSAWNETEVNAVIALLGEWVKNGLLTPQSSIGIVTPFRLQMKKLEQAMAKQPWGKDIGEKIVGTAHTFQGDERDIMIFSPVIHDGMPLHRIRWVADTEQLLNVAITRARGALHIVGDKEACSRAGGYLGKLTQSLTDNVAQKNAVEVSNHPVQVIHRILNKLGLWNQREYPVQRYFLDFFVVSPFGRRYDIEVDGLQHLSAEKIRDDDVRDRNVTAAGFHVIRIHARDVNQKLDLVEQRLKRLC